MAVAGSLVVTISAKTADFEASMRKTTATLKFTEQQAAQVSQAFGKLGDSFTSVGSKASRTSSAMQDLKGSLLGLAAGVLSFQAITRAIEGSVQAALRLEALNTAFTVITGSAKGAAQAMQFVRETADRLGVQVNDLAGGYKTLLAATEGTKMSGEAVKNLFLGITEAGRAMALSSEDIAGALRPIGQILNQQAIQGDEWRNEFGSRIPKAMQLLLEATNGAVKSQGELSKAMEEGKLKGEVVFDIMNNVGELLRSKYTPAAMQAAQGTQASFERLQTAVTDLAAAFGQGLAPALAEAARALTAFISQGRDGAGILGDSLLPIIRQITSVLLGLAGAFVVTGKAIAAFSAGLIGDTEAARIGWQDVGETISNTLALQEKMLAGGFAAAPGAQAVAPAAKLTPITLGAGTDEGKVAKKTAADRESERSAKIQLDLIQEIADAHDVVNAAIDRGISLDQARLEHRLHAAGMAQADIDTLTQTMNLTKELEGELQAANQREQGRVQLKQQLQDALDKELFTERELLQQSLARLRFDEEGQQKMLALYDERIAKEQERLRIEKEREDTLRAQADHVATMERLQQQLEPRLRFRSRREQLVAVQKEMLAQGATEFELAASDVQIARTLDIEQAEADWARFRDFAEDSLQSVGDAITQFAFHGKMTFKDMVSSIAEDFFRLSLQTVMQSATKSGGWLEAGLNLGLKALGLAGGVSGGGGGAGALAFVGGDAPGMQHGGPVMPGKFYTVGERGPELFVSRTGGTIIPNGQAQGQAPMTIVFNITTPDVRGFQQSTGALSRGVMHALNQARGNM